MIGKKENSEYAESMKELLMLRYEPVAIKLIKRGETYPGEFKTPDKQMSHCQAVMSAKNGMCLKMPLDMQGCNVGASCLGMMKTPEKVITGDFHFGIGIHDSPSAAAKMISERINIPYDTDGEVICPLSKADFEPDVVAFVDIPERIYWFECLFTHKNGGRAYYSTAPFQCACEDITAVPIVTGKPNISIGCFGCRKKTDMKSDEMAIGVPYALIPEFVSKLNVYKDGVFTKAKRN
ncbi:MAG: DUF169 domain-containing protein [archaeon]|nr:DUF169 domain-containing protein [archaeon]